MEMEWARVGKPSLLFHMVPGFRPLVFPDPFGRNLSQDFVLSFEERVRS
jgi:hypothetical protein